jgi:hypothetical protein
MSRARVSAWVRRAATGRAASILSSEWSWRVPCERPAASAAAGVTIAWRKREGVAAGQGVGDGGVEVGGGVGAAHQGFQLVEDLRWPR